jgi:flagellar L-ring protein precursor FlgH
MYRMLATATVGLLVAATAAMGQARGGGSTAPTHASSRTHSSSLYVMPSPGTTYNDRGEVVNPHMQRNSYAAVSLPEPRRFAVHDLVTIIVREQSSATVEGELETEKEVEMNGQVSAMIDLLRLLETRVEPDELASGSPKVDLGFANEFEGSGDYARKDEVVTRLTARVVDVKPNGTLALEARTSIHNDDEQMTITVTGYCRAEDVGADNTILSTQMYDLQVDKQHAGEIRKASEKGLITKVLEFLFNF